MLWLWFKIVLFFFYSDDLMKMSAMPYSTSSNLYPAVSIAVQIHILEGNFRFNSMASGFFFIQKVQRLCVPWREKLRILKRRKKKKICDWHDNVIDIQIKIRTKICSESLFYFIGSSWPTHSYRQITHWLRQYKNNKYNFFSAVPLFTMFPWFNFLCLFSFFFFWLCQCSTV